MSSYFLNIAVLHSGQKSIPLSGDIITTIMHTGQTFWKCYICGRSFSHSSSFKRHKLTHTGQKPWKCDICGKPFSESGNLKKHTLIHTGQKPWKCDVCGKSFSLGSYLKSHALVHTGQTPWKCDICEKSFTKSNSLKSHTLTHTEQKPWKCDICGKSFAVVSYLKRHKLRHTGKKKCHLQTLQSTSRSHEETKATPSSPKEVCLSVVKIPQTTQKTHTEEHFPVVRSEMPQGTPRKFVYGSQLLKIETPQATQSTQTVHFPVVKSEIPQGTPRKYVYVSQLGKNEVPQASPSNPTEVYHPGIKIEIQEGIPSNPKELQGSTFSSSENLNPSRYPKEVSIHLPVGKL